MADKIVKDLDPKEHRMTGEKTIHLVTDADEQDTPDFYQNIRVFEPMSCQYFYFEKENEAAARAFYNAVDDIVGYC